MILAYLDLASFGLYDHVTEHENIIAHSCSLNSFMCVKSRALDK